MKAIYLLALVLIAGCADVETPEHARYLLMEFCRLKASTVGAALLTPEQLKAGKIVCGAVNMPLGVEGQ